jgi:hypothetical protein
MRKNALMLDATLENKIQILPAFRRKQFDLELWFNSSSLYGVIL